MFDYGRTKNCKVYPDCEPPQYRLEDFPADIPIILFSGGKDKIATPKSTAYTESKLGNKIVYSEVIDEYGHVGFIWGTSAADRVYKPALVQMNSYRNICKKTKQTTM